MRFLYCACAISHMLNDWTAVNREASTAFILASCVRYVPCNQRRSPVTASRANIPGYHSVYSSHAVLPCLCMSDVCCWLSRSTQTEGLGFGRTRKRMEAPHTVQLHLYA